MPIPGVKEFGSEMAKGRISLGAVSVLTSRLGSSSRAGRGFEEFKGWGRLGLSYLFNLFEIYIDKWASPLGLQAHYLLIVGLMA